MPKKSRNTQPSFSTSAYAAADHSLGRVGTVVVAAGAGAGAGAAVGHFTNRSSLTGAGIGAAVGIAAEEAGRLLVDDADYKRERLRLATKDLATLASEYGLEEMLKAE